MTKPEMIAVSYEQILQWQTKGFDPHRFSYHILQEELLQAMLNCSPADLKTTDTIVGEENTQSPSGELQVIRLYNGAAMKIFNCGQQLLRKGQVPGVTWLGRQPNKGLKAVVEIDLSHPVLSKMGLTAAMIKEGRQAFYTVEEASKIEGISTSHGYKRFRSETIKFGDSNRIPVGVVVPVDTDDSVSFLNLCGPTR